MKKEHLLLLVAAGVGFYLYQRSQEQRTLAQAPQLQTANPVGQPAQASGAGLFGDLMTGINAAFTLGKSILQPAPKTN